MTPVETAISFFRNIELAKWHEVEALLTPDFRYFGPLPEPVERKTWLELQEVLRIACPDWSFHVKETIQKEDYVQVKVHITGTHTAPLDLSSIGLGVIPATGIRIELPDETAKLKFNNDLISELHAAPQSLGGLMELLSQLGIS